MNPKVKELLQYISQSTMSITDARFKPRIVEKVTFTHSKTSEETIKNAFGDIINYEYDIPNKDATDKRFRINIYKISSKNFWGNDTSKYITQVTISLPPGSWGYSHLETIVYCSWLDEGTLEIQKGMFNYLELKNTETEIAEENQKYEEYIKDIKKTISVSISRDNKLNNILEQESQSI